MAIVESFSGSETISTTEWSLTTDTAGPDADTTDGEFQIFLDLSALTVVGGVSDVFVLKVYEKVLSSSTQRLVFQATFSGVQAQPVWVSPVLLLMHGWEATLDKIAGDDRAIDWSIRTFSTATIETAVAAIEVDTQDIQGRLPAALVSGRMDSSVGAMAADVLTAAATAADFTTEVTAALALSTQVDALEAAVIAIETDTQDIQSRLPAALVTGRIDASVGAMAADVLTAAATAADFTTEVTAALALSTQVDALEAAVIAIEADTQDIQGRLPTALVLGRMDSSIGAVAANAITAAGLAADVTTEIQAGLALSTQVDALETAATAIEADTQDIQGRLPAALVSGRMDSSVGAMAANVLTAAAMAADVGTELATAVWAKVLDGADTAQGMMIRAHAILVEKATGLVGALATFYRADGVTIAVESTQNTELGTRAAPSTKTGD